MYECSNLVISLLSLLHSFPAFHNPIEHLSETDWSMSTIKMIFGFSLGISFNAWYPSSHNNVYNSYKGSTCPFHLKDKGYLVSKLFQIQTHHESYAFTIFNNTNNNGMITRVSWLCFFRFLYRSIVRLVFFG